MASYFWPTNGVIFYRLKMQRSIELVPLFWLAFSQLPWQ
jgi:hypothetical protein